MDRWKTAGTLINDAATELNLTPVVDPFASADPNFKLLCKLLGSICQDLNHKLRPIREATLTIAPGDTGLYSLPDDFVAPVDQTGWNRTGRMPLLNPTSSQAWQAIKATGLTGALFVRCRIVQGQFEIMTPLPAVGTMIALEYISKASVQSILASSPDKDVPDTSTDVVLFEPLLITRALKWQWRGEKGFDVTKALAEYQEAEARAISEAVGAPLLDLGGGPRRGRAISDANVADGNWGV